MSEFPLYPNAPEMVSIEIEELSRLREQNAKLQGAVEFCQRHLKYLRCEVPAEFADIIFPKKPRESGDARQEPK